MTFIGSPTPSRTIPIWDLYSFRSVVCYPWSPRRVSNALGTRRWVSLVRSSGSISELDYVTPRKVSQWASTYDEYASSESGQKEEHHCWGKSDELVLFFKE